jgi:cytochrome c
MEDRFNNIAMATLSAMLFIFASRTGVEIATSSHALEHPGWELPKAVSTSPGAAPAEEAFSFAKIAALLPKASAEGGQDVFRRCTACHTGDKGGRNGTGPNLYGIINRKVASHEGFNYTPAMKGKGGDWDWEHLASYLHDPKAIVPNTAMNFEGVKDNAELADLLSYLRTLSDSPPALPPVPAAAPAPAAPKDGAAPPANGAAPAAPGAEAAPGATPAAPPTPAPK